MPRRTLRDFLRYLQPIPGPDTASGPSDAELLERYVHTRDQAAFELLVWRHAVLVYNVCRRLLPGEHDAEDAFQATFLALVCKAHAIVRHGSVASWLYTVAYRVALEARERARKVKLRERVAGTSREDNREQPGGSWHEVRPTLPTAKAPSKTARCLPGWNSACCCSISTAN